MTKQIKPGAASGRKTAPSINALKLIKHSLFISSLFVIFITETLTTASAQDTPTKATSQQMVDALHAAFGKHPNARAVHAKGIILEGDFKPSAEAKTLTTAPHFQHGVLPVTFRFSDFTGIPDISDLNGASSPRGFAIKFHLPDGSSTDIISHSFNGFPTANTDEFRELLLAISKSGPDAPHPNAVEQFLGTHPVAKTFLTTQKPPSVSYATLSYFGVNAFKFTNAAGESHFIRYQMIPEGGDQFLTAAQLEAAGPDYLSGEIKKRVAAHTPIRFNFYAQIADEGDIINNPSIAWPDNRRLVLLGVLTIKSITPNTLTEDHALTFNPGNLPDGIEPADPMVIDRKKMYPISVAERNN